MQMQLLFYRNKGSTSYGKVSQLIFVILALQRNKIDQLTFIQ